jgi:hypothetical protein
MEFTPEKLELSGGFYEYGGQDFTSFYLAVLTNMGVQRVAEHISLSLLLEAIEEKYKNHSKLNFDNGTNEAMLNRFNRGIEDLKAVAGYLGSSNDET